MASLSASTNPIVVDFSTGAKNGGTTVHYDKGLMDEIWYRLKGDEWQRFVADPMNHSGLVGAAPEVAGDFPVRLAPGEIYEIGIFSMDRGPLGDPDLLAHLVVFAIARWPRSDLIESEDSKTGGTWHRHVLSTVEPTFAVLAAASRTPLAFNADGYPFPGPADGATTLPVGRTKDHDLTTLGLLPGTPYVYLIVVIDDAGQWDYRAVSITTLRRTLTVQFKTLHVYNDGDASSKGYGEARFLFRVMFMNGPGQPELIEEFERPESDVDDWSESDRPYHLGYAHLGQPKQVHDGEQVVWVSSMGYEDDDFGTDAAWSKDASLSPPIGPGETVTDAKLLLDCPDANGGELHYGVDIVWSVAYEP